MPQLDVSTFPSLLLWLLVGFGLLYLGLRYVILPRLSAIQEQRFGQIENLLDQAESLERLSVDLEVKILEKNKAIHSERLSELLKNSERLDSLVQQIKEDCQKAHQENKRKAQKTTDRLYKKVHASLIDEIPTWVQMSMDEIYGRSSRSISKGKKAK